MASLKTEIEAVATPPSFFFVPTLENYFVVQSRSDYLNELRLELHRDFGVCDAIGDPDCCTSEL